MTIDNAMTLLEGLRAHLQGAFSPEEKAQIAELHQVVFDKPFVKTKCNDCYRDAVIRMYLQLKKNGTMISELQYRLRAGYLINSPLFHGGKVYSNANLTNEVAEEFLQMFPMASVNFDRIPERTEPKNEVNDNESKPSTKKRKKS